MMCQSEPNPILDHVRFLLENSEASSCMISMVSNLDLQSCSLSHHLHIIRLDSKSILEAFRSFEEILLLLVDGAASMPAEHALHLALKQSQLGAFKGLSFLPQSQQKQSLQRVGLGMIRMRLQ